MGRGRPKTKQARRAARRNRRLQQKIGDLFEYKNLFVARTLTPAQRRILNRITRGLPQLRTLRQIVEEVYRLFDRRCRMETALAKLAKLRVRVRRFQAVGKTLSKLFLVQLGKGPHLPRRQTAAGDFQRRGTGQPPPSEDAEDRLSCPHTCSYQSSDCHRHASGSPGPRTIPNNPVTPLRSRRMNNAPFPCYSLDFLCYLAHIVVSRENPTDAASAENRRSVLVNRANGPGRLLVTPCRYMPLVTIAARSTMAGLV